MGIGQFEAHCVSPIQLVTVPACIANGGTILRPYLAEHAADQAVAERLEIPGPMLRCLRRGMERVCEPDGTARWLVLQGDAAGIRVAAKTGTSQWGPQNEKRPDNAWLIGYAPADKPQVAFAMLIHAVGTGGGRACSGVAKHVLERYFQKYPRE
jgi:cell division protein FtsI/penicillin-binding protein 2